MKIDYNTAAHAYARFRQVNQRTLECLTQIGGITATSRVLEVGCGSGNYISAIAAAKHCECHGLEPSAGMLAQAQGHGSGVRWAQGEAQALPYADASFDFLFCVDVVHHVTEPDRFLREAFRVLHAGGRLCIATDSEWTIRHRNPLSVYFPATVGPELQRYHPIDRLRALTEQTGFVDTREEIVEMPYALERSDAFRERAFSCLHLIPESSFRQGLSALETALQPGPLSCVDRHVLLHACKPAAQPSGCNRK